MRLGVGSILCEFEPDRAPLSVSIGVFVLGILDVLRAHRSHGRGGPSSGRIELPFGGQGRLDVFYDP